MDPVSKIRLIIPALVLFLLFMTMLWLAFEVRNARKRQAMANLASIAWGKPAQANIQKPRDLVLQRAFVKFAQVTVSIGERINIFRRMVTSVRMNIRKAGIIDKNALTYVIGAKFFALPMAPVIAVLVLSPYDFYMKYSQIILISSAIFGFFLPDIWLTNLKQKRQEEIAKNWADVLDVMLISVASGQSIEMAMRKAVLEMATVAPELSKELTITLAELSLLENRSEAYRRLAERVPFPFVKNFVFDVIQSETLGTPLGRALTQIARENRIEKIQAVEKKAAALGPKLTIPMIFFFFPILFIIIMAPALL